MLLNCLPDCADLNRVTLAKKEALMQTLKLKAADNPVQNYCAALRQFEERSSGMNR